MISEKARQAGIARGLSEDWFELSRNAWEINWLICGSCGEQFTSAHTLMQHLGLTEYRDYQGLNDADYPPCQDPATVPALERAQDGKRWKWSTAMKWPRE
jgi:hypothetical protein